MIRAVEQLSQGKVVLRPGTLYGALDRLTRPLTIAGIVAGLLAGWLLVAALARRRLATALATAGLAAVIVARPRPAVRAG